VFEQRCNGSENRYDHYRTCGTSGDDFHAQRKRDLLVPNGDKSRRNNVGFTQHPPGYNHQHRYPDRSNGCKSEYQQPQYLRLDAAHECFAGGSRFNEYIERLRTCYSRCPRRPVRWARRSGWGTSDVRLVGYGCRRRVQWHTSIGSVAR
jgi:hypothetical protein